MSRRSRSTNEGPVEPHGKAGPDEAASAGSGGSEGRSGEGADSRQAIDDPKKAPARHPDSPAATAEEMPAATGGGDIGGSEDVEGVSTKRKEREDVSGVEPNQGQEGSPPASGSGPEGTDEELPSEERVAGGDGDQLGTDEPVSEAENEGAEPEGVRAEAYDRPDGEPPFRAEESEPGPRPRGFGRRKGRRKSAGEGAFARGRGLVEGMMEGVVPDVVRKLFVAGLGTLATGEEGVRRVANEFSLPKEAVSFMVVQVQNTKRELFRIVANEIRSFLENVNLGAELQKILTSLTFEVKMQIRLKPSEDDNSVRPQVRGGISVKPDSSRQKKEKRSRDR